MARSQTPQASGRCLRGCCKVADLQFISADHIVIRPMIEADLLILEWEGAYTQYRKVFRDTFDGMQRGERLLLVAAAGALIVGQVFIQLHSTDSSYADGRHRAYLYALRVRPAWQGQGLGTRLIAAAEATLRARGFDAAVIAAGQDNPGALRLYQCLGYRIFAEDPGVWTFSDEAGQQQVMQEPCWVLEKKLI